MLPKLNMLQHEFLISNRTGQHLPTSKHFCLRFYHSCKHLATCTYTHTYAPTYTGMHPPTPTHPHSPPPTHIHTVHTAVNTNMYLRHTVTHTTSLRLVVVVVGAYCCCILNRLALLLADRCTLCPGLHTFTPCILSFAPCTCGVSHYVKWF